MSTNLGAIAIVRGTHATRDRRMSLMEAVAMLAGESHSDEPQCVCPVIAAFGRSWNNALTTDEDRLLLLRPLIPLLVGTRSTPEAEMQRAFLALDWLIRIHLPAWLHLTESLQKFSRILYKFPQVSESSRLNAVAPIVMSAREAARMASASMSLFGAWSPESIKGVKTSLVEPEVQSMAWVVAGQAASEAVKAAAGTSARFAIGNVAKETAADAWEASREAAWAAAGPEAIDTAAKKSAASEAALKNYAYKAAAKRLHFTVTKLQLSAVDLLHQMVTCH